MNAIFTEKERHGNANRRWRIVSEIAWWLTGAIFVGATTTLCTRGAHPFSPLILTLSVLFIARFFIWEKFTAAWNDFGEKTFFRNPEDAPAPKFDFRISCALAAFFLVVALLDSVAIDDFQIQWRQILTGNYNDWHPLQHTFFVQLVTSFWRSQKFFFVAQALFYAGTLAALFGVLQNHCRLKRKIALGIVAIAALHPAVFLALVHVDKCGTWMIALATTAVCVACIVMTRGAWLRSPLAFFAFVAAVFAGTTFRHNGIFFTIPLILTLPFCIEKKHLPQYLAAALCVVAAFAGSKIYIEKNFHADKPVSQTYIETIGVPFGMLAYVAKSAPEKLPPEAREFCESLAPADIWQRYYLGNANTLKIDSGLSANLSEKLENFPPEQFFKMFAKTFVSAPKECARAFAYHVFTFWRLDCWPGTWVAILLFAGIFAFPVLKWKVLPLTLPTFFYQAGTSLLMYSNLDTRFYYYAIPVCVTMTALVFALYEKEKSARGNA